MNHYIADDPFRLQTDASKAGISGVLYQIDHQGDTQIVALVSRTLTGYEQSYRSTELELLAIVYAVFKLRTFLLGQNIYNY